jgi:hypothetical protein
MQATTRVIVALERLKGLFHEIPDVRMSLPEATEFSGLAPEVCGQLLRALVDVRFLTVDHDGVYRRGPSLFVDDVAARRQPARAALR